MKSTIPCTLCGVETHPFFQIRERDYFDCPNCRAVIMDPDCYVSREDEIYRYTTHDNDVEDPRYQNFVSPLVKEVRNDFKPGSSGLDYGSGTGPVAAKLLRDDGYQVTTYDPFFEPNPEAFQNSYDFIISSEVIEHFHYPAKEFRLLKALLQTGGFLYCMTLLYSDDIDFRQWHYMNDETHVIFYRKETAEWISSAFGFSAMRLEERIMVFQK